MDFLIIIVLQGIGIGLHVMQKISGLGDKYPDKGVKEIRHIFWKEDWDTLCVSGLVLLLNLVCHYIIDTYTTLPKTIDFYILYAFGVALTLGYAGQRLIYKWLGSSEKFLDSKVNERLN